MKADMHEKLAVVYLYLAVQGEGHADSQRVPHACVTFTPDITYWGCELINDTNDCFIIC